MSEQLKPKKAKGPIRFEAVIPVTIIIVLIGVYFTLFFDSNLKSAIEWTGYTVIGSELDIEDIQTSFVKGTFKLKKLEITDPDIPSKNMIEIGEIRFGVLWDGLLRAKVIINEMAVENIRIGTSRKKPGKVKPPEPKSTEPSAAEKELKKVGDQALKTVENRYNQNVLGDIAKMLAGGSSNTQFENIEQNLQSKKMLKDFESELSEKSKKWEDKLKTLPQGKDIEELGKRISKIKTGNFNNPQELVKSLQELDAVIKEANSKVNQVNTFSSEFNTDLNGLNAKYKEIDNQIKKDISDIEKHFKIPQIDAKSLTETVLFNYLNKYLAKFEKYKTLFDKYAPPNLLKKKTEKAPPDDIKPHPRENGITYEFGNQKSYPILWIKNVVISSVFSGENSGNIKGQITDITTNQKLTGKPTVLKINGSFPSNQLEGLASNITYDSRSGDSNINLNFSIDKMGLDSKDFVSNDDVKIGFKQANSKISANGLISNFKNLELNFNNSISNVKYDISAKNEVLNNILTNVFSDIPVITIDASAKGPIPNFNLDISSNIGPELQKGFEKQINKKINEAKEKLNAAINEAIGKEKQKVEAELSKLQSQINSEIKKVEGQINKEKLKAEGQADKSKKDSERQAQEQQKKAEGQAQKQLQEQGQKAVDDLKKKFGL